MPYTKVYNETLYNEQWLRRAYVEENRNASQVAELIECDKTAVLNALRRYNIPIRDQSESQKLAKWWRGSSSPRPRGHLRDTIHNVEWLKDHYITQRLNYATIGRLAGCSAGAVCRAVEKSGIPRRGTAGKRPKRIYEYKTDSIPVAYAVARQTCPDGPCAICGGSGEEVNHKDRNPRNNDPVNLERLCGPCHHKQHAVEVRMAFAWLLELGVDMQAIHERARKEIRYMRRRAEKLATKETT